MRWFLGRALAGGKARIAVVLALACFAVGTAGGIGTAAAVPAKKPKPTTTTVKKSKKTKVVDPCVLVSQTQAETLLGMPLQAGVKSGTGSELMCQYTADPNGPVGAVQVAVGAGAKKTLDIDKDNLHHEFTQPAGISDETWLENGTIFFRKKSQWGEIHVVSLDAPPDQIQSGLQSLATTVAKKL